MRFVSLVTSVLGKTRRAVSQALSVESEDKPDPVKQAETLRQIMLRLNKLEATVQPEATEFEVNLNDTGALVELPHGFKTLSVRWYVVAWLTRPGGISPVEAPRLTYDPSSTPTSLFLRSYTAGRAIVRVEPAQAFVDVGPTVDTTGSLIGPLRARATYADLVTHQIALVPIPDNCVIVYRVSIIGKNTTTTANVPFQATSFVCCERKSSGATVNVTNTVVFTVASAGCTGTVSASGNSLQVVVGNSTAGPQTMNWAVTVEPINSYYRDEP